MYLRGALGTSAPTKAASSSAPPPIPTRSKKPSNGRSSSKSIPTSATKPKFPACSCRISLTWSTTKSQKVIRPRNTWRTSPERMASAATCSVQPKRIRMWNKCSRTSWVTSLWLRWDCKKGDGKEQSSLEDLSQHKSRQQYRPQQQQRPCSWPQRKEEVLLRNFVIYGEL